MIKACTSVLQTRLAKAAAAAVLGLAVSLPAFAAWEPTKPVEFVVPAGTGGGAGGRHRRTVVGADRGDQR